MSIVRFAEWMHSHGIALRRDCGELQALSCYTLDGQLYPVWTPVECSFGWCVEFLGY